MKKEFPIFAYLGVHHSPNKEEHYKDFADCGFNISMYYFDYLDADNHEGLKEACEMADKYGIGVVANWIGLSDSPAEEAQKMLNQKGFFGYFIGDEPRIENMKKLTKVIDEIKSVDTKHNIYVNLLPSYSDDTMQELGVPSYRQYLDASNSMDYSQVSFDFYPVTSDEFRKKRWYENLRDIKSYSESIGKPWWGFILSVPHNCYPQPTKEHLRIQAYTNLAFGCQGLEYFTYQTQEDYGVYHFYNGPIEKDGYTKTDTWNLVRDFNLELKPILPLFYGAKHYNVKETKMFLWWSYLRRRDLPFGIKHITVSGRDGALISTFVKNNNTYMMIVNGSYAKDVSVTIRYKYMLKRIDKATLEEQVLNDDKYTFVLHAGDCEIFRVL